MLSMSLLSDGSDGQCATVRTLIFKRQGGQWAGAYTRPLSAQRKNFWRDTLGDIDVKKRLRVS